ncbi:hypothetical protein N0V82_008538 [Gnomoniopsis sp. IMI 355080]|nr:hypothetical protein N0V82_008538 [Gnomoniopsis sp. IMI 355080]
MCYVEPDSHEKVYPNWAPIGLPGTCWKDRSNTIWINHRRVMTSVINDIAREVIKELELRRRSPFYHDHPDTLTGLTVSSHTLTDDSSDWGNSSGPDENESFGSDPDDDSEGGAMV